MKKFLMVLVCGLLVVGIAGMGHAFPFGLFSSGSGKGKGGGGGSPALPPGVTQHDFKQLHVQSPAPNPGNNGPKEFDIKEYLKGPEDNGPYPHKKDQPSDPVVSEQPGNGFNPGAGGGGYLSKNDPPDPTQNSAPVPEPATMVLLGIGLVGLARYGRKNFNS